MCVRSADGIEESKTEAIQLVDFDDSKGSTDRPFRPFRPPALLYKYTVLPSNKYDGNTTRLCDMAPRPSPAAAAQLLSSRRSLSMIGAADNEAHGRVKEIFFSDTGTGAGVGARAIGLCMP